MSRILNFAHRVTLALHRPIAIFMAFLWTPALVFATTLAVTGGEASQLNVPLVLMMATMFVSTLAGVTTLAMRVVAEMRATSALLNPWLYCASHMLGSWCAGVLAFVFSMQQHADVWVLLASVLLASFCGAKGLEKVADMWSRGWAPK
jgi:hypothetical protein